MVVLRGGRIEAVGDVMRSLVLFYLGSSLPWFFSTLVLLYLGSFLLIGIRWIPQEVSSLLFLYDRIRQGSMPARSPGHCVTMAFRRTMHVHSSVPALLC